MNVKTLLSDDGKELYMYIETEDDQVYLTFDIATARKILLLLSNLIIEADAVQKLKTHDGDTN